MYVFFFEISDLPPNLNGTKSLKIYLVCPTPDFNLGMLDGFRGGSSTAERAPLVIALCAKNGLREQETQFAELKSIGRLYSTFLSSTIDEQ